MTWKITPVEGGWWLFYEGKRDVWIHVYRDKWFPVFLTLEAVFEKIKERT